jgi:OFA family oxalate/formate antiporter-like MFS transporter
MFTLFVILESIGTLPGGILVDKYGLRVPTIIGGLVGGLGIFGVAFGPNYTLVLVLWCIGSFFAGFIYNSAVTVANKWFPDRRGVVAGLMAGAFSWGSIPFVFPILGLPKTAPISTFFNVLYAMAALITIVPIVTGVFMKGPPRGWLPPGFTPKVKAIKRPSEHQYTFGQTLSTWQMWILVASFILISSAGLAGVANMVAYSASFGFSALGAVLAVQSLNICNGLGRLGMGASSERLGRENAMILSYILCGIFLFVSVVAGHLKNDPLFVVAVALATFFWGPLFSLFPTIIGHYYGEVTAGSNYGLLYAIAKGSGGIYGGVLFTMLTLAGGFPYAMSISGLMAVIAGFLIIPLKFAPPAWKEEAAKS